MEMTSPAYRYDEPATQLPGTNVTQLEECFATRNICRISRLNAQKKLLQYEVLAITLTLCGKNQASQGIWLRFSRMQPADLNF